MPSEREKPNITAPSASMTMAKKYGSITPRLSDYTLPPTRINYAIIVNKYVLVSILRYFSI